MSAHMEPGDLDGPWEVYHETHIGNDYGHIATCENLEVARRLLAYPIMVEALRSIAFARPGGPTRSKLVEFMERVALGGSGACSMNGPWHMPEHPDERDDGGAQERQEAEDHAEAFSQPPLGCADLALCTAQTDHIFGNAGFHVYRCAKCGYEEWL